MKKLICQILATFILAGLISDASAQYRRPFGPNAPWNVPVRHLNMHPESADYADKLYERAPGRPGDFNLSFESYTYPVYEATEETPNYPVQVRRPEWGNLHGKYIPFDPSWVPAEGTDAQIIILDPVKGYEWDLWQVKFENGIVNISNGNLIQEGLESDDGSNPGNYWTKENGFKGSRGIGIQYLAMLVRPDEVREGEIRHALSMPIRITDGNFFVYPATKLEHPGRPAGIPEGMRFALNVTDQEIEEWVATVPEVCRRSAGIIARALRDYGWFITDTSGAAHLQFENRNTAPEWEALGLGKFTLDGKEYPRDLMDGLMTKERIYTLDIDYSHIDLSKP